MTKLQAESARISKILQSITDRDMIAALAQLCIDRLDQIDGDADFEPLRDDEPNGDKEPSLGYVWRENGIVHGGSDDLEVA